MDDGAIPYVYVRCDVLGCGVILRSAMDVQAVPYLGQCSQPVRCPVHVSGYGARMVCWADGEDVDLYSADFLREQAALALDYRAQATRGCPHG